MDEFWSYAGKDYDAFSSLYYGLDDEMIQKDFSMDENIDQYDSMNCIPVASVDNHYSISLTYYIVSGVHPNTHMDSYSNIVSVSYIDGEWKLDYSQDTIDVLNEKLSDDPALYPAGYLEAQKAGRNTALFGDYNWMYLDSSAVYNGHLNTEPKFAWQDENGNLIFSLWMANGTNNNIYYTYMNDTLTDSAMGEVINLSGAELEVPIKRMSSMLYEVTIPADQVLTGTQKWGELDNHINVHYN